MSEQRNKDKEKAALHEDPINYTCGKCKRVHKFISENPYVCEYDIAEAEVLASEAPPAGGV